MIPDLAPGRQRPLAAALFPAAPLATGFAVACVAVLAFVLVAAALPRPATAAILVLSGPAGAEVTLDGTPLGALPLAAPEIELPPGPHLVRSRLRGHQEFRTEVTLDDEDARVHLHVRHNPLKRRTAVISSLLLAGSGQRYVGRRTFGWVLTGAEVGGLLTALMSELAVQDHRDDYLLLRDRYEQALTEIEIERYRREADAALADAQDAERRRDAGLLVAGAAVALSALDAWLRFPGVAGAGEVPVDTGTDAAAVSGPAAPAAGLVALHAGLRLRF